MLGSLFGKKSNVVLVQLYRVNTALVIMGTLRVFAMARSLAIDIAAMGKLV